MAISNNTTGLRTGVCTSTTRPTAPYEGQMIYETDTDLTYIWNGSAFYQVSGSTAVGNSGLVFVAGGALSLTTSYTNILGVFNSTFKNYRVILNITARSTSNRFDMRYIAGTTATAVGYFNGGIGSDYASNTTLYFQRSNNDNQFFFDNLIGLASYVIDIFQPFQAAPTRHTGQTTSSQTAYAHAFGGVNLTNNSHTGFQLATNTGTMSLDYLVMGYREP